MANDGRAITVGTVDDLAMQLDERQYDVDKGPRLQALREGHIVGAPDLSAEHAGTATERGDGAGRRRDELHTPLIIAEHTIGVVNL